MKKKLIKVAILAVSMVQMAALGISPALAEIRNAFPGVADTTVQTIATFPSIVVIIVTIIAGLLASIVSKKHLTNLGVFLLIVAGAGGFLFHGSIVMLYVWAALIGTGMGLFIPSVTVMIAEQFEGAERGVILGQQSTFINGGGIIYTFFGGLLATVGWNYNYLIYCFLGIPIFIIGLIGLPKEKVFVKQEGKRARMGFMPFYYALIAVLYSVVYSVLPTNVAMLVDQTKIGDTAIAGTASALMMFGGVVSGFLFGKFSPKLKDYMMSAAFIIVSAGLMIMFSANSVVVLLIGAFIAGNGISWLIPQVIFSTSTCVEPAAATMAISMVMGISGIGMFLSPIIVTPLAQAINAGSVRTRFLLAACIGVALAVIFAITTTTIQKKRAPIGKS